MDHLKPTQKQDGALEGERKGEEGRGVGGRTIFVKRKDDESP